MEPISNFISTYSKKKSDTISRIVKKSKTLNKEQSLAEEIWLHFHKQIKFPMLMGLIKRQGSQAIREFFYESIKSDHPDHLALFLWKIKNNKVTWVEDKSS